MDIQEYNSQIISEFLTEKKDAVPHNTYRSIQADCNAIHSYLLDKNILFSLLSSEPENEQYISFLTERYASTTVKRRLCTLRSIICWGKDKGYISQDSSVHIADGLSVPPPNYAPAAAIADMLNFCSSISESDTYMLARSKLECLMVIICGYKVSELQKLRVSDTTSEFVKERMQITGFDRSDIMDIFLQIRDHFVSERLIKSTILFVNQNGEYNKQIHLDYKTIRSYCGIDKSVTLSALRNTCIQGYNKLLENEIITAKVFNTSARWVDHIKKTAVVDRERRLIKLYRELTPEQQDKILKDIKCMLQ